MSNDMENKKQEVDQDENEMTLVYGIKPWSLDSVMLVYKYKNQLIILPESSLSIGEILSEWRDEWEKSEIVVDNFSIRSTGENGGFDTDERDLDSEDFLYIKGFIDALYKEDNLYEIVRETVVGEGF